MLNKININKEEFDYDHLKIFIEGMMFELIEKINFDDENLNTGGSIVKINATVTGDTNNKDIAGKWLFIFRNQGNDFDSGIILEFDGRIRPKIPLTTATTACRFTEYIFTWLKDYIVENNIKDKNGQLFVMPYFYYTPDYFLADFPD